MLQLSRALLACALLGSVSFASAKQQQQQQQQATKLKRDAALSFGSGIYHGPSHKYLPPVASGYESTYGSLHGNGLASSSGFDFASLDTDNTHHYHHYSHHHHAPQHQSPYASSHGGHGLGHTRPVYVHAAGGGSSGGVGASYHHRQQAPKVETYIVQTSNAGAHGAHGTHHSSHGLGLGVGLGGSSIGGYKYAGHDAGAGSGSSSAGSSFLSLLSGGSGAHKQHGGNGGGGSTTTYLLATPGYAHVQRPSLSHGAPHFSPALSHGLEQEEHAGGYSYDSPSIHFKQPLSSYGVPLLPGYEQSHHVVEEELAEPQQQQHHQHQHHEQHEHQSEHANKPSHLGGDQQTPVYALGHKGLGHFTYTSSKPHALNTDIHHLAATSGVSVADHNELVAELTKAPFKPSAFLGAKHEPSQGYEYATPSTQYLQPPTASGYDYPAPSVLYGAPGQSGDSATPIFEPESTYLPPVTSYGAPATPTHSYN